MTRAARSNGRSPATYSLAVKTAAVLLLTVTAFLTAVSGVGIGLSAVYGIYDGVSQEQLLADLTESYLDRAMHDGTNYYLSDPDGMDSWIRAWSGLYYQVKDGNGNVLSGNYQGETGLSHLEWRLTVPDSDNPAVTKDVTLHLWADSGAMHTWYRGMYRSLLFLSRYRVTNVAVCLAGLAASICLLVFLLSAAGRHPGEDGVREGAIDRVPFDLFTFFVGLLEAVMLLLLLTALPTVGGSMFSASAVLIIAVYIPAMLLLIGYAMSLAVRIKAGTVFRHTLVWICLRAVGQSLRWLFRRMPPATQRLNMLFSATLSYRVRELAFEQMNNAEYVEVEPEQKTGHRIKEELFYPSNEEKMRLLQTLLEEEWPDRAIVFANTKHRCEDIWGHLAADGHRVGLLTGDVAQKKRLRILEEFTRGDLDILVATDVAARGLHIPAVTHVFNYDLPDDCEDYVHRIGRTGRAGASGHSISLACEEYALNLPAIETYIGHSIPVSKYNPDALMTDLPKPLRLTRARPGNGPRRNGPPRNRRRSG